MTTSNYARTPEQDEALGLQPETSAFDDQSNSQDMKQLFNFGGADSDSLSLPLSSTSEPGPVPVSDDHQLGRHEVIRIPQPCPSCAFDGEAMTAITDIPHFKEVIIMAFNCSSCGFRNNDIK